MKCIKCGSEIIEKVETFTLDSFASKVDDNENDLYPMCSKCISEFAKSVKSITDKMTEYIPPDMAEILYDNFWDLLQDGEK